MAKKVLLLAIPFLLSFEKVFALENTYPSIAGKTLTENSGFLDFVAYGFAFCIALGGVIMFAILVKAGLEMITGAGTHENAKNSLIRASFGFGLLLSTYLILNTINSAFINPQSVDQPCVNGVAIKIAKQADDNGTVKEKLYDLCVKSSSPDISTIKEVKESDFPSCSVKSVISYSDINYQGTITEVFNDTTNKTKNCGYQISQLNGKSIKIIPKQTGIYLYDKEDYKVGSSSAPIFIKSGTNDLNKNDFDNKTRSINVISADYSEEPVLANGDSRDYVTHDYYGAFVFENPEYAGKCLAIDSNNDSLVQADKAIGSVDLTGSTSSSLGITSVIVFNKTIHTLKPKEKSYIYLYAVKNCGKNINKDVKNIENKNTNENNEENNKEEGKIEEPNTDNLWSFNDFITYLSKKIIFALGEIPSVNIFNKNTFASASTIVAEATCTDGDKDGYCYWEGATKPASCLATCKAEKDCNDNDSAIKKAESNGQCLSGISPADPVPDPIVDPDFGIGGLYDVCKIEIPEIKKDTKVMDLEKLISEECSGKFQKTKKGEAYDIVSLKFGGPARVVIKGTNGNCHYFDSSTIEGTGSCVADLRGTDIFDTTILSNVLGSAVRPKSIIIIPKDQ